MIAVSSVSFSKNPTLRRELADLGTPIRFNETGGILDGETLAAFIDDAEIALVGTEVISRDILMKTPRLKFIAKYGVGLDNIPESLLSEFGIKLGWTGGVNARSVSELVLGFALGHLRRVTSSICSMREGHWIKHGGRELSSCRVGIIGLGAVGKDLARLLRAFGATVSFNDIADRSEVARELGLIRLNLEELVAISDVVSLHVPLTPETKGMVSASVLSLFKHDALLINTSRGSVVDFPAVVAAVADGKLGGFAVDVYPEEPFNAATLKQYPSIYCTPHIGGNSQEAVLSMGRSAIHHIAEHLKR